MTNRYKGEVNGLTQQRHGYGTNTFSPLFKYEGQYSNNLKHGKGRFIVTDGPIIECDFLGGEITGNGKKTWPNGTIYEGSFLKGEQTGKGKLTKPDGETYDGEWLSNKMHGYGVLSLPKGAGTYRGYFKMHKYHGEGELIQQPGAENLSSYHGTFFQGLRHGKGEAAYKDESAYVGAWHENRRCGDIGETMYRCGSSGIYSTGGWDVQQDRFVKTADKLCVETSLAPPPDEEEYDKKKGAKKDKKKPKPAAGKKGTANVLDTEIPMKAEMSESGALGRILVRVFTGKEPLITESDRTLSVSLHRVLEAGESLDCCEDGPSPSVRLSEALDLGVGRETYSEISTNHRRYPADGLIALFHLEVDVSDSADPPLHLTLKPTSTTQDAVVSSTPTTPLPVSVILDSQCISLPADGAAVIPHQITEQLDPTTGVTVYLDFFSSLVVTDNGTGGNDASPSQDIVEDNSLLQWPGLFRLSTYKDNRGRGGVVVNDMLGATASSIPFPVFSNVVSANDDASVDAQKSGEWHSVAISVKVLETCESPLAGIALCLDGMEVSNTSIAYTHETATSSNSKEILVGGTPSTSAVGPALSCKCLAIYNRSMEHSALVSSTSVYRNYATTPHADLVAGGSIGGGSTSSSISGLKTLKCVTSQTQRGRAYFSKLIVPVGLLEAKEGAKFVLKITDKTPHVKSGKEEALIQPLPPEFIALSSV